MAIGTLKKISCEIVYGKDWLLHIYHRDEPKETLLGRLTEESAEDAEFLFRGVFLRAYSHLLILLNG